MAYDPSTEAGGWVAAQAARRRRRGLAVAAVIFLCAGILAASALGGFAHPLLVLALSATVVVAHRRGSRIVDEAVRWTRGARAEASVGADLDTLRPRYVVMHDIEQEGEGNVDHVVSGPSGVFLVETKARRYDDDAPRKAKRQAAKLGRELGVWVTPVICLDERRDAVFRHQDVWVVPRTHLLVWIDAQRNTTLPFERLARFADTL